MDITGWLPTIIEVAAIAGGLIVYIMHWSVRGRLRRIRCAKMILAELHMLANLVEPYGCTRHDGGSRPPVEDSTTVLFHNTYDGLVNSASISYLDQPLQEQLHIFYKLVIKHNYNLEPARRDDKTEVVTKSVSGEPMWIKPSLLAVTQLVATYLEKNKRDKWRLLKLFRAYDGD